MFRTEDTVDDAGTVFERDARQRMPGIYFGCGVLRFARTEIAVDLNGLMGVVQPAAERVIEIEDAFSAQDPFEEECFPAQGIGKGEVCDEPAGFPILPPIQRQPNGAVGELGNRAEMVLCGAEPDRQIFYFGKTFIFKIEKKILCFWKDVWEHDGLLFLERKIINQFSKSKIKDSGKCD